MGFNIGNDCERIVIEKWMYSELLFQKFAVFNVDFVKTKINSKLIGSNEHEQWISYCFSHLIISEKKTCTHLKIITLNLLLFSFDYRQKT